MKGTRPLDNDEIRSVSTCFAEVVSTAHFHLGTFTASCLRECPEFPGAVQVYDSAIQNKRLENN